jgi:gamma-glutamyltranspeptidase/glutathione hydrolase
MCPVILRDGDRPVLAAGACGGRRILAAVVQLVAFVAGFGMDAEAAAHHPRIDVSGPEGLLADQRLPPDVLNALAGSGPMQASEHVVVPLNFAAPNLIALAPDGTRVGVSDAMSPWSAALAQSDGP